MERDDVGCVRLYPCPAPTKECQDSGDSQLGLICKTDKYSVSMQVTLWKRNVFEKILKDGWSPVEMEFDGSKESSLVQELFLYFP